MVVIVEPGTPFEYEPPEGGHANFVFASASSPDAGTIEVELNGSLVDKVHLNVPHSWWMPAQKWGKDSYSGDDKLVVRALDAAIFLRLDLDEHKKV